ncbi:nitrogenase-associated protein [Leptolyngbya sp. Heron Island J]|uniref:ArsC/Spx/MgsR family protein n=1 Tax=Leptolyngbya sp. Heron Island J TaxID=1385935 RepID=UPI0003B9D1CA|nr:ArsC/Spx/MgsR family protein [Leptolyngbya sp. Heron Island J]ESA34618.1 nitrogenase-associated protein [Leptolyngbya sp. Heron Island J]
MATVDFYEKPGCIGNAKQKALLQTAGHIVRTHNLLTEAWTPEQLRPFFGTLPVSQWFNPTAPPIKAGAVHPEQVSVDQALALMVKQPILIRRPLLRVKDCYAVGFDLSAVDAWIGLAPSSDLTQDVETCPSNL